MGQSVSLVNADFETVIGEKPAGWSLVTKPPPEPSKVWGWRSVGKNDAPSGAVIGGHALQVWAWATSFELDLEKSQSQVKPGESYRVKLHFWQDGETGTAGHLYVKVRWLDSKGDLLSENAFIDNETAISPGRTHPRGDFGWEKAEEGNVHCDLVAPPSAAYVSLRLRVGKWVSKGKPYYIDEISITPLPRTAGTQGGPRADLYTLEGKRDFLEKIITRGEDFWKGDHWIDHRNYANWIGHSSTYIYYVLAHAAYGGSPNQVERVGSHYAWVREKYWNSRIRAWVNDGDVMANACMALNVASGLSVGGSFLDKNLRAEMEADLKDVCRWLATRNTAVLNNDDLRACNQDAIAAAGLALSASYFDNDAGFRRMALDKLRLIIKRSEGPFWVEGGVDKAYQIAGESSFALAADLLWEDLTLDDKRRVVEILMRPYAAGAMGLEKMRSESSLGAEAAGSTASAILARVHNPLIIADVRRTWTARQRPRDPWWIFDSPAIAYYWGIFQNADLLAKGNDAVPHIGWGGQAKLGTKISEGGRPPSIDQKTFLTSPTGVTTLFSDSTGWNDHYVFRRRKATEKPVQYNPGGLRYIVKERTVSVWADGKYDYPRLVYGESVESNGSLKLDSSYTLPGFVGSQYHLKQSLSESASAGSAWAGTVEQQYVVLGDYLIGRIEPDNRSRQLPDLRYEFTIRNGPVAVAQDKRLVSWQQGSLYEKDETTTHALLSINSGGLEFAADTLKPYLVNESIRHWVNRAGVSFISAKPEFELSRVKFPVSAEQPASWFLLASGSTQDAVNRVRNSIAMTSRNGVETVTFEDGKREYGIVYLAGKTKRSEDDPVVVGLPSGEIKLDRPIMSVFQCFVVEDGRLAGFFTKAAGVSWTGQLLVQSTHLQTPAQTSAIYTNGIQFLDVVDGEVSFATKGKTEGISLITGAPVDLSRPVANDRFWYRDSE
ncbi:hypothetical protein OpiT1DRAFT_05009 [Opitutaceae bacterium TAV1]|nr:hypothetical protein OpiT1DRAFT_05009 [Opitutaceae bacterium TAV1]